MARPFDIGKLRKFIDKSVPGLSYGFNDPKTWLDTGCYALNYLISNKFNGGIPLEGKFTMFAGDSGSGKSYIVSGNLIKDAQKKGVWPIFCDTENGLDKTWMAPLGVDLSDDAIEKLSGATIDDVAKVLGEVINLYRQANDPLPYDQRPKMLIVIDSLGMLITPNQDKQFVEGDMKGDMGIKAKQITSLIRVAMSKIASQPIGLICTNHVYDSQDKYKPDIIPGGHMLEFASSVIVQMNKLLLREDADGNKLADGEVAGIRSSVNVRKSRYAKPFEKLQINIPYEQGMDPYSGLFDLFEKKGVIKKEGMRYTYVSPVTGEVKTEYRKRYRAAGILDQIMAEWEHIENAAVGEGVGADLADPEVEA